MLEEQSRPTLLVLFIIGLLEGDERTLDVDDDAVTARKVDHAIGPQRALAV